MLKSFGMNLAFITKKSFVKLIKPSQSEFYEEGSSSGHGGSGNNDEGMTTGTLVPLPPRGSHSAAHQFFLQNDILGSTTEDNTMLFLN